MATKIFVTWEDVENYLDCLAHELDKLNYKPVGVYGIPRGGLILATRLSYKLNIPLLLAPMEGCIIIDDIADSGRTLLHYTKNDTQFNRYYITTMYYHSRSLVEPDYYMYNKKDMWIVYPWEKER